MPPLPNAPLPQVTTPLSMTAVTFIILLIALILSAYILYRRYQSRRQLMQRITELEALGSAGRTIVAAELHLDALAELIAQESGQVIDNSTFQVAIFDDHLYRILYWVINGEQQPVPQTFDLSAAAGLVGWVRDSRQPLLIQDFQRELEQLPAQPRYISDTPPRSAIFIPMISGEEVIGIIAAQSSRPHRFSDEDQRRLIIIANQAAAAISRAHLYEAERRRAAYLALVVNIAQEVNAINDLDEIVTKVVQRVRDTFGYHPVSIFCVDEQTQAATIAASSQPTLAQADVQVASGQGIIGTAVANRASIVVNNTANDLRYSHQLGHLSPQISKQTRAEVAIPLIVNDQLLGILDVQSQQANAFGGNETTVLEALAATVAAAIYKAQQFTRQEEQAWASTVQFQIADAISRSNDLEGMATAVTRLVNLLLGTTLCGILLRDRDEETYYQGVVVTGAPRRIREQFNSRRIHLGDWHALDAVHVGQLPLFTDQWPRWLKPHHSRPKGRLQLWPLATKQNQLGILVVELPERGDGRSQYRQDVLANISDQLGQAVESAYLRRALQEEGWVNTALLQVAGAVNSLIDLNEILNTIVRLVPMLVGVESAIILIYDESAKLFHIGSSFGLSTMARGLLETLEIAADELPLSTLEPSESVSSPASAFVVKTPPWMERVLGTPHAHAIPLNAGGQLVGAMLVGATVGNGRTLPHRRLSILNGIAQQAAIAVLNNQLYAEAAERNRLTQELNVARDIQSSLLPTCPPQIPHCTVASHWQAARQVSGDFYDFLELGNGRYGFIIADVADKGIPAALFMALCRTVLRTVAFSRLDPAEVLERVNDIIISDAQSDLFVTVCYVIWDANTQKLIYANAGHNPPLLLRHAGKQRQLRGEGMALGVLPQVHIARHEVHLHPGDILLLYTDGVTEAINEDFDEFGLNRMRIAARSAGASDASATRDAIMRAIASHVGGTPQFDDITLVVVQRQPDDTN